MTDEPLWSIFVNACLINNFVLAYFLGICPFLGVSAKARDGNAHGRRRHVRDAGELYLRLRDQPAAAWPSTRPTCASSPSSR